MGVPRSRMPQVAKEDYDELFAYLKDAGVHVKAEGEVAEKLRPIQKDFADKGVEKALDKRHDIKPVIISSDNFLIDGHHRWLAQMNIDRTVMIPVIRADIPGDQLLGLISKFTKTTFKDIY